MCLLPQALEIARQIQDEYSRAQPWKAWATRLTQLSFWQDMLHGLSHLRRPELLPTVSEMNAFIVYLGGEDALREMTKAMREVCEQWR